MVAQSFMAFAEQEIKYRNDKLERKQTPIEVLRTPSTLVSLLPKEVEDLMMKKKNLLNYKGD